MNATFTRRMFAVTGLAAIGGALYGLLPFFKRSKASEPDVTHLLDEPQPAKSNMEHELRTKVLSSEQEAVRDWYRKEFEIEPVYDDEGNITKFVNIPGTVEAEFPAEDVRRYVEEAAELGDIRHTPIPDGVGGNEKIPLGIGAATEAVGKTLH